MCGHDESRDDVLNHGFFRYADWLWKRVLGLIHGHSYTCWYYTSYWTVSGPLSVDELRCSPNQGTVGNSGVWCGKIIQKRKARERLVKMQIPDMPRVKALLDWVRVISKFSHYVTLNIREKLVLWSPYLVLKNVTIRSNYCTHLIEWCSSFTFTIRWCVC